eukprot:c14694_g1_i1.p1 GENE.c14694_g1_i1~~c14694_g1_i1.p1  ORF type:complete len:579 (+),score=206.18 c14694_g1_i1:23-1738(+)
MKGKKESMMDEKTAPLLQQEEASDEAKEAKLKRESKFFLGFLLLSVIIIGTTNRVTFKVMQFANVNYLYFVSQFTTIVYLPINLGVVLFKQYVTKTITPEMWKFPQKSLFVMGLLDSLQGLLIVVGGGNVPGMMQNLLLQGAVPVTMLCSILLLRPTGCKRCRSVMKIVKAHGSKLKWEERTTLPQNDCSDGCVCRAYVESTEININQLLTIDPNAGGVRTLLTKVIEEQKTLVVFTSGRGWKDHVANFYSIFQYIGATIVIAGLVVSVWPAVGGTGGDAGPILGDMIFFSSTIPIAMSAVYKEIAFRKVELDVWYLNLFVALYQTICSLLYFPLAAIMSGIAISDVPSSLYNGFMCYATGTNYISLDNSKCSIASDCNNNSNCCDSCDGSISNISAISAFWGMNMYMFANILYNVVLVLVIKHGSAALMYVASTIVLPLGAICFSLSVFMGNHAQPFTSYMTAGLCIVIFGLLIYRFARRRDTKEQDITPLPALNTLEHFVHRHSEVKHNPILERSTDQVRSVFYGRLGIREYPLSTNSTTSSSKATQGSASPTPPSQGKAEQMWMAGEF